MSTQVIIREASVSDASGLAELGRDTFCENFGHLYASKDLNSFMDGVYAPELQKQEILAPDCYILVAEHDGKLLGFSKSAPCKLPVSSMPPNAYELHRLYVREEAKRLRIGTKLMQKNLGYFAQKNASEVFVGVYSENYAAQKFYAANGFQKIQEYHFMVGNHRDDEWIMQLMQK